MSNEIAVRNDTVKSLLASDGYKKRFGEVLGKRAPQFMASISNAAQTPGLAKCEPKSVLAAAFVAATIDLPIDRNLGLAWLIPYKTSLPDGRGGWTKMDVCQFQMGYKGFINLAMRSGQYSRLNAFKVNKDALKGHDDCGEVEIDFDKLDETKEVVGYSVVWKLTNGFRKLVYWSKERVLEHAGRFSQGYRSKKADNPWEKHFDEMALKTVIKFALSKWGILSVEMRDAMKHDAGTQIDVDAEVTPAEIVDAEINPEATPEEIADTKIAPENLTPLPTDPPKPNGNGNHPPAMTQQAHLEHYLVKDCGISFEAFRKWAGGQDKNADSWADFSQVPEALATRLLRNKDGMKQQLQKI